MLRVSLLFMFCLSGCSTVVPNLKPFADGTAVLRTSISESFTSTQSSLTHMASIVPKDESLTYKEISTRVALAAEARIEALDAFVDYADRLDEIAASGTSQQEKVHEVADAVGSLANSFKDLAPAPISAAGPIVSLLAEAGGKAVEIIIEIRTVASLDQAVKKADPAVRLLTEALSNDLGELDNLLMTREDAIEAAYKRRNSELLNYYNNLVAARKVAANEIKGEFNNEKDKFKKILLSDSTWKETKSVTALKSIEEQIKMAKIWRDPLLDEMEMRIQAISQNKRLIGAIRKALQNWQEAHSDLSKALANSRRPNLRSFAVAVEEVKNLSIQLRNLPTK